MVAAPVKPARKTDYIQPLCVVCHEPTIQKCSQCKRPVHLLRPNVLDRLECLDAHYKAAHPKRKL